ncbi:MAG: SCO1664 family protein [Acidimicrobiales bacterium]
MDPDQLTLLREGTVEVLGRIPWGSNATLLATVQRDGECVRAVYKPRRGERSLWDFPRGLDRREVAAYELSEALGWGLVPETVLRDDLPFGVGSLQRFVPFAADEHYFTLYEDPSHHPVLRTICCFDLLCNQTDRKSGHCLLGEDGRVWAVDNGLAFHTDDKLRTVIWEFGGQPIPDQLRDDVGRLVDDGLPPELTALLDPDECAALGQRGRAVADDGVFPIDGSGRRYPWPLV